MAVATNDFRLSIRLPIMRDSGEFQNTQPIIESKILLSKIRILLWDIDGTLLQSTQPGGFKQFFAKALEQVYGARGNIDNVEAAGITDVQIVCQALQKEGFTVEKVVVKLDEFIRTMCVEMRKYIAERENVYETLAGVKEILQATSDDSIFLNALLTGNVGCGAKIKTQYVDVWKYFENSPNAFGEISHERKDLVVKAGKLFDEKYDFQFKPEQFIVIGDTPHDILAARHFGAKVVCVETGRKVGRKDLESSRPDALIKNLSDTQQVLDLLRNL